MIQEIIRKIEKEIELRKNMPHNCEQVDICYGLNRAKDIVSTMSDPGWIPVMDRLPNPGDTVLAYIKHNYAEDGWRAYRVYEFTDHWVGMGNLCEVIAWIPLPGPYRPESKNEEQIMLGYTD